MFFYSGIIFKNAAHVQSPFSIFNLWSSFSFLNSAFSYNFSKSDSVQVFLSSWVFHSALSVWDFEDQVSKNFNRLSDKQWVFHLLTFFPIIDLILKSYFLSFILFFFMPIQNVNTMLDDVTVLLEQKIEPESIYDKLFFFLYLHSIKSCWTWINIFSLFVYFVMHTTTQK